MADENQGNGMQQGAGDGAANGNQQAAGTPGPVPYERFKEVNERLRTTEEQLAQFQRAQQEAQETQLKEQQRWKELAEKRDAELKGERLARLRLEVATEAKLPVGLAARLQGESREEMLTDAQALAAMLAPAKGPGTPPPPGDGAGMPELESMTPAQVREWSAKNMG